MTPKALRHALSMGLSALVSLASAALAQNPCPEGCITFGSGGTDCGSASSRDSSFMATDDQGLRSYQAAYEITPGTIGLDLMVAPAIYLEDSVAVTLTDEFRVTGIPPGGPLTFQARLNATGYATKIFVAQHNYAFGWAEVGLRESATNTASFLYTTGSQGPQTVVLTLTASPEEPFNLTLFAKGAAVGYHRDSHTSVQGQLVFGNLPSGAYVESCSGYLNDTPVPVRKSTWGRLKSLYR